MKRILIGFLVLLGVLLLLALLLPTILSSGPVRRAVVKRVNAAGAGTLAVERWSLGWWCGVQVEGLRYDDGQQRFGVSVKSVAMTSGLLRLLAPVKNLGAISVEAPHVWCQIDRLEAPPTRKPPPPSGKPTGQASSSKAAEQKSDEVKIPLALDVAAKLALRDGQIEVRKAGQPNTVLALEGAVDCPSLKQPVQFTLSGRSAVGRLPGTTGTPQLQVSGAIQLIKDGVFDPAALVGDLTLQAKQFDLAGLALVKVYVPALPEIAGLLNANVTIKLNGLNALTVSGDTEILGLSLQGGALGPDKLRANSVRLEMEVGSEGNDILIRRVALQSPFATVQAGGHFTPVAGAKYPRGQLSLVGDINLAVLAEQLPATLKLRPDVRVRGGQFHVDGKLATEADAARLQVKFALKDFQGTQGALAFQQSEPIEVSMAGALMEQGPIVEAFDLKSGFASATGSGNATGAVLKVDADLAAAAKEVGQVVDLGGLHLAGRLHADVRADLQSPTARRVELKADVTQLAVTGLSSVTNTAAVPDLRGDVDVQATVTLGAGGAMALKTTIEGRGLELRGGALGKDQPRIDRLLVDADLERTGTRLAIRSFALKAPFLQVQAEGQVDTVPGAEFPTLKLQSLINVGLSPLAAQFPNSLHLQPGLRITDGMLQTVARLDAAGKSLTWDITADLEKVAAMRGQTALQLSAPVHLESKGVTDDGDLRLDAVKLTSGFATVEGQGGLAQGTLAAQVDLGRAMSELGQFINFGKLRAAGQLGLTLAMESPSKAERKLKLDAGVDKLVLAGVTPAPIQLDRVHAGGGGVVQLNAARQPTGLRGVALVLEGLPLAVNVQIGSVDLPDSKTGIPLRVGSADLAFNGTMEALLAFCRAAGLMKDTLPIKGPLGLTVKVTGGQDRVQIQTLQLTSTPLAVNATGQFSEMSGDKNLNLKGTLTSDCSELAMLVQAFSGYRPDMSGKATRDFTLRTALGAGDWQAILRRTDAQAGFHADRWHAFGITATGIDLDLLVRASQAQLKLKTVVNEGQLSAAPYLDLTREPSALVVPDDSQLLAGVKLNEEMASELLARIHPIFRGCAVVGGTVGLKMDQLRAPLGPRLQQDTTFAGTLSLTNVVLRPQGLLGQLLGLAQISTKETQVPPQDLRFECRDGRIASSPLVIRAEGSTLTFSGSVGLDQTLKYTAELPLTPKLLHRETLPPSLQNQSLTVPIGGTVSSPRFDERAFLRAAAEFGLKAAGNTLLDKYLKKDQPPQAPAETGDAPSDATPSPNPPVTAPPPAPKSTQDAVIEEGMKLLGDFLKGPKPKP